MEIRLYVILGSGTGRAGSTNFEYYSANPSKEETAKSRHHRGYLSK